MENNRVIIIGIVVCVLVFTFGILIGHYGIKSSSESDKYDVQVAVADFQKSCNARCAKEANLATTCSPPLPRYYVTHHLNGKTITVDGRLDDEAWKEVPWTENFMDIRGPQFPAPPVKTKAKIRWDDEAVYVGAYLQEPHVWAINTETDGPLHLENNFEIYFDVDKSFTMYKQVLINALGTTWDLMMGRAYMDQGKVTNWDGVRDKGVYTDGVVNNATVPATYWSVEMSIPFVNLNENTTRTAVKAVDDEWWFMMMGRARYDLETLGNRTDVQIADASWFSWNPTGAVNLHLPSKWGLLYFEVDAPSSTPRLVQNKRWLTYQALFDVFNALKSYKIQNGLYVDILSELDLPPYITSDSCLKSVTIQLNKGKFMVTIESKSDPGVKGHIRQDRTLSFTDYK